MTYSYIISFIFTNTFLQFLFVWYFHLAYKTIHRSLGDEWLIMFKKVMTTLFESNMKRQQICVIQVDICCIILCVLIIFDCLFCHSHHVVLECGLAVSKQTILVCVSNDDKYIYTETLLIEWANWLSDRHRRIVKCVGCVSTKYEKRFASR